MISPWLRGVNIHNKYYSSFSLSVGCALIQFKNQLLCRHNCMHQSTRSVLYKCVYLRGHFLYCLTESIVQGHQAGLVLDVSLSLINRGGSLHTSSSGVKLLENRKLLRNTPPTERVSEYYNCATVMQDLLHSLKGARPQKE